MNDIPNKGPGSNIPAQTQKIENTKIQENPTETPVAQPVQPETKDISNVDTLGRSLVNPDNLESDLKFIQENPKAAALAMKYFDAAYNILKENGHQNPYEEACKQMGTCSKF